MTLYADNLGGTFDKLVIKGLPSPSVKYFTGNGTDLLVMSPDGKVLARLAGQLSSPNKYNGIEFQNPDGTTAYLPLPQKLSDLPVWNPVGDLLDLLPDWSVPAGGIFGDVPAIPILRGWGDPLVLDLDGDGVEVTKMGFGTDRSMVYFDMDNDGVGDWKTRSPHGGGDDRKGGLWLQTYLNNNAEFGKSQAA